MLPLPRCLILSLPAATLCLAASIADSGAARAFLVTSSSGFSQPVTATNFHPIAPNTTSQGPVSFTTPDGDQVRFTSTSANAVINYSNYYAFDSNGFWQNLPMAGLNSSAGLMEFTFVGRKVAAVGGFLNYVPGSEGMFIAALDGNDAILETHALSFATGGGLNKGASYFIQRPTADIQTLRLGGPFAGIALFAYDAGIPAAVPAPLPLLGAAAALGISRQLRRRVDRRGGL